mmetsp:Transcript_1287/g.1624  ORF Transcript_1287/g.1624 Transcript_1287/m.1624 type:complete len:362 (+) Transcript_1287:1-1086(+)
MVAAAAEGKDGQKAPFDGTVPVAAAPSQPIGAKDVAKCINGTEDALVGKSGLTRIMEWSQGRKEAIVRAADARAPSEEELPDESQEDLERGGGPSKARNGLRRVQETVTAKLKGEKVEHRDDLLPLDKPRTWEITMQMDGIVNVLTSKITAFFALSFRPEHPETHKNHMHPEVLTMFTPSYTLHENGELRLDTPWPIHDRKRFTLSYKELSKHVLVVDMWQVSKWTFNTYYGTAQKSLLQVANGVPETSVLIRTCTEPDKKKGKKKKKTQAWDVAIFRCTLMFEEVFDFELSCENWNLELNPLNPSFDKWKDFHKCLTFVMPKNHLSIPDRMSQVDTYTSDWRTPSDSSFWPNLGKVKCKF